MAALQIVWFKRDLRIVDHQPLAAAAERGLVLPLYVLKYRNDPYITLSEHPRGTVLQLTLYAVVSVSPRARAAASHASAVSIYFSHIPDDRRWNATPC